MDTKQRQVKLPISGTDFRIAAILFVCALILNGIAVFNLEYFRHTEADRTLIAWEMYESGDYLIPHLTHAPIFTKPPLFYWLLAFSFKIFGGVSEAAARVPSVVVAALFALMQFFVLRAVNANRSQAMAGAAMLATSSGVMLLGAVAEIDMLFGFLTAASLYAFYFGVVRNSALMFFLLGIVGALAFLTKGPPFIFFLAAAAFVFSVIQLYKRCRAIGEVEFPSIPRFLGLLIITAITFAVGVALWLYPVIDKFGSAIFIEEFRIEVVDRVMGDARINRGPFFYIHTLALGLLPWVIFLGAFCFSSARTALMKCEGGISKSFFVFNCVVLGTGLFMLSIASGKSSRYLFPVLFAGVNIAFYGMLLLKDIPHERWLFTIGRWLGPVLVVVACAVPFLTFVHSFYAVPLRAFLVLGLVGLLTAVLLTKGSRERSHRTAFVALVFLMLTLRIGESEVFSRYRNSKRTVKPAVVDIDSKLPAGAVIYHMEFFERWVTYYLKQMGRESYRLTPDELGAPRCPEDTCYLLLNYEEELWRILQLREGGAKPVVLLDEVAGNTTRFLLVSVRTEDLKLLKPSNHFPTFPTLPFYGEREFRADMVSDLAEKAGAKGGVASTGDQT